MKHILSCRFIALVACLCCAQMALAQGDRRDRGSDRGGSSGFGRGPTDYSQFDANKDGTITPAELPEFMRRFIGRTAERAGLDPNQPMSVEKLNAASQARYAEMTGGAPPSSPPPSAPSTSPPPATTPTQPTPPSPSPSSGDSRSGDKKPSVLGFGEKDPVGKVPGFNVPLPPTVNTNQPIEKTYDPRVVERVQRALRENDANGDGVIDAEELKKQNWSNPPADESDLNRDGKLSKHELAERYAKRYANTPPPPANQPQASAEPPKTDSSKDGSRDSRDRDRGRDSRSSGSSGSSSSALAAAKKVGRFLTATERLPKGLPDWFLRNDADGDGQIGMVEYAASWSDTTAAEFEKYDLNGDGIITPDECLDALKATTASNSIKK